MSVHLPMKLNRAKTLFLLTVCLPTALSILYFGVLASDVYISESRFVVRSPEKPSTTGLGVILKSAGFSNAGDEVFAAESFVVSRDALKELDKRDIFEKSYDAPTISMFDRFDGFGFSSSFEDLFKYYQKKVSIEHDTSSSISTLSVRAYSAKDARLFNERLLEMAEATVNRLNERGRQDLIRFASVEVENAKEKARAAATALASFRNREGVLDPERQALVQTQMISKLQDELIATRTELAQLRRVAPRNSQIEVLDVRASELANEIVDQTRMVAGDKKSLAANATEYQRLQLDVQFADKQLASALGSLEEAQNEARRKQAYVERIVQPNLPDSPLEPRRTRGIIATFLLGIVAWGVLSMLFAGVQEHHE